MRKSRRRELPNAIDFPVATTFLPSPSRKLALDLANGAQSYANGLMKRPDFRFSEDSYGFLGV
jgi:hypothetical protein